VGHDAVRRGSGDAAVVQASRPRDNRFGVSHREYVNQGKKK